MWPRYGMIFIPCRDLAAGRMLRCPVGNRAITFELVEYLLFRSAGVGHDRLCVGLAMLGFALQLRNWGNVVLGFDMRPVRARHSLFGHPITSAVVCPKKCGLCQSCRIIR